METGAGLTISLVEGSGAAAAPEAAATGIWQNFPVKLCGQRQRSFCRQMPPFLQSSGQRTAGATRNGQISVLLCSTSIAPPGSTGKKPSGLWSSDLTHWCVSITSLMKQLVSMRIHRPTRWQVLTTDTQSIKENEESSHTAGPQLQVSYVITTSE